MNYFAIGGAVFTALIAILFGGRFVISTFILSTQFNSVWTYLLYALIAAAAVVLTLWLLTISGVVFA